MTLYNDSMLTNCCQNYGVTESKLIIVEARTMLLIQGQKNARLAKAKIQGFNFFMGLKYNAQVFFEIRYPGTLPIITFTLEIDNLDL